MRLGQRSRSRRVGPGVRLTLAGRFAAAAIALGLLASLGAARAQTIPAGSEGLNSVLWMQRSAEYAFNTEQTYRAATRRLSAVRLKGDALIASETTRRPATRRPAIILDLDETVFDNSPFQANVVSRDRFYHPKTWDSWSALEAANLVPGAKAFLLEAQRQGFRIFYVSNRECPMATAPDSYPNTTCAGRKETMAVLKKHGLPFADDPKALMMRGDQKDWQTKSTRRQLIAKRYRVAMLIGDDLGDFLPEAEEMAVHDSVKNGTLVSTVAADAASLLQRYAAHFGRDWFILPNPTYGSWEKAITARQVCTTVTPPLNSEDCYAASVAHKRELLIGAP